MLYLSGRLTTGATERPLNEYGRLGWLTFSEQPLVASSGLNTYGFYSAYRWAANGMRWRWHGAAAQGQGTGFRNRHWTPE